MKKSIIAALIGGIILFFWQFLSWGLINLHYSQNSYTANQDEIYEFLRDKLPEGEYFVPTIPQGATPEQREALTKKVTGQPWMQIKYHENWNMSMPMNMTRGMIIDIISVFLLIWILLKFRKLDLITAVLASLSIGLIGYFTGPYLNSIWFETNTIPDLIDAVVQWGLVGLWLGFYLPRDKT